MGKFINMEMVLEPESTLFQPEIDVILAVIDQVLTSFGHYPTRGTFILVGQKRGEAATNIIRFNLADEESEGSRQEVYNDTYYSTSNSLAEAAIDEVLSWPENSVYDYQGEAKNFGLLPSGIYRCTELKVLVLNTVFGRFLASCYANFMDDGHTQSTALLIAIAETFAQMGKEDKILQQSAQALYRQAVGIDKDAIILVRRLFLDRALPALSAWHTWHEPANNAGELTLFFE